MEYFVNEGHYKIFPAISSINDELKELNCEQLVWGMLVYKYHANNCLLAQLVESAIILMRISKDLLNMGIVFNTVLDSLLEPKAWMRELNQISSSKFMI